MRSCVHILGFIVREGLKEIDASILSLEDHVIVFVMNCLLLQKSKVMEDLCEFVMGVREKHE